MQSTERTVPVFIVFYAHQLSKEETDAKNRLGENTISRVCYNSFSSSVGFYTRLYAQLNYPFSHVEIAFWNNQFDGNHVASPHPSFLTGFSVTYAGGLSRNDNRNYRASGAYSFLILTVPYSKAKRAYELCNEMANDPEKKKCTTSKVFVLEGTLKFHLFLKPLPIPTAEQQVWMCSEFVTFVLQQSGIVEGFEVHPSYITVTELFLYLCSNKYFKSWAESYSPFKSLFTAAQTEEYKMTNAAQAYLYLMHIRKLHKNSVPKLSNDNCMAMRVSAQINQALNLL